MTASAARASGGAHARESRASRSATMSSKGRSRAKFDLTRWVEAHAAVSVTVLAVACFAALASMFALAAFTDFSASADFVYTQF